MTTGCLCATRGCQGLTPQGGGTCPRCQVDAMPPGLARAIREALYGVLYGTDVDRGPCQLISNEPEASL